ncbi:MAG: histidine kinase, partial [archaeon]|nr:histidine kinase [archaeon]
TLFLPPLLLILICFFTSMKYSSGLKQKIILGEYSIMPILSVVAFLPNYSASITYLTILISMLLMYSEVYLDRGIRIVRNEAAMAEQKVNMMVTNIEPTIPSEALDSIADIKDNPEETKVALKMFKTYLEKNVSSINQRRPIPISDELEHVEIYIKLEKMRFRDNVNVTFDIKDRDFNIPALTLQMLVENAIKHGITQREEGGTIDISIFDSGTAHVIIVKDDGVGFDVNAPRDSERSHVGLDIISTRLKEYLNGSFEIASEVGVGTVATVTIPKRK